MFYCADCPKCGSPSGLKQERTGRGNFIARIRPHEEFGALLEQSYTCLLEPSASQRMESDLHFSVWRWLYLYRDRGCSIMLPECYRYLSETIKAKTKFWLCLKFVFVIEKPVFMIKQVATDVYDMQLSCQRCLQLSWIRIQVLEDIHGYWSR